MEFQGQTLGLHPNGAVTEDLAPQRLFHKAVHQLVVGDVHFLGTGKTDDNGKKVPFDVKVGDIVLTSRYGGTEVKVDDKEYKIVSSDDILAIVG